MQEKLIQYLSGFLTEKRTAQFHKVLDYRTRYLCLVLEDVYQSQNASAVIRTCDCLGIQDIHCVQNRFRFTIDRNVSMGAHKWISFHYHKGEKNNSLSAISSLKKENYRIIATSPSRESTIPENLDLSKGKAALFFGTELTGLSKDVLDAADEFIHIPMFGFTQSYNLSVSAALILYSLVSRLHQSTLPWNLSPAEKSELLLDWMRKSIKSSAKIEARFLKNN